MSWTDKELSEMAKAAQAEQKFAYQDSFWNEMEAMLPAKKKRGFVFFWLALIPVVATLGYMAVPATQNSISPLQAAKTIEKETVLLASMEQRVAANESGASVGNDGSSNVKAIPNTKTQGVKSTSNVGVLNPISPTASKATSVLAQKKTALTSSSNPITTGVELTVKRKSIRPERVLQFTQEPKVENNFALSETQGTEKIESPIEVQKSFDFPSATLNTRGLSRIDIVSNMALQPLFQYTRKNFWNAYAEGGFAMGQSYMASQVGHTSAFSLGVGARYDFNSYFIQFGIGGELQNVKYELSEREKIYHTSSTVFENRFSYKQLYRLETPLTFGYQFPKHMFQLSVIPSYLLGTKMQYEHLKDGTTMRDETIFETEHGKKTAWNDFSTSFGLGYGYRLTKTITLGANVKWQLMNQLNNNVTTEGNVRPLSGQVFIRKTLK